MANTRDGSDEYLPDSDDSRSEDERPNRWTGPPSTWQQLNSAEINTLTALNEIRSQDLSIHLYNAFALKHRHDKREGTADALKSVPNQVDSSLTDMYLYELAGANEGTTMIRTSIPRRDSRCTRTDGCLRSRGRLGLCLRAWCRVQTS